MLTYIPVCFHLPCSGQECIELVTFFSWFFVESFYFKLSMVYLLSIGCHSPVLLLHLLNELINCSLVVLMLFFKLISLPHIEGVIMFRSCSCTHYYHLVFHQVLILKYCSWGGGIRESIETRFIELLLVHFLLVIVHLCHYWCLLYLLSGFLKLRELIMKSYINEVRRPFWVVRISWFRCFLQVEHLPEPLIFFKLFHIRTLLCSSLILLQQLDKTVCTFYVVFQVGGDELGSNPDHYFFSRLDYEETSRVQELAGLCPCVQVLH